MQRILKLLLISLLSILIISPVYADNTKLIDNADIYSDEDESRIAQKLSDLSYEYNINFSLITNADDYDDLETKALNDYETYFSDAAEGICLYIDDNYEDFYLLVLGENTKLAIDAKERENILIAITNIVKEDSYDQYNLIADSFIKNAEHYYIDDESNLRDPLIVDDADLLSNDEEYELTNLLERASLEHGVDFVVYTTFDNHGKEDKIAAADFYDYNNYADEGYMLYINMETRYLFILTSGDDTIYSFTDSSINEMTKRVASYLTDANYYDAVVDFIDCFDEYYIKTTPPFDPTLRDPLVLDYANVLSESDKLAMQTSLSQNSDATYIDLMVCFDNQDEIVSVYERVTDIIYAGYYRTDAVVLYINENLGIFEVEVLNVADNYLEDDVIVQIMNNSKDAYEAKDYIAMTESFIQDTCDNYNAARDAFYQEIINRTNRHRAMVALAISSVITAIIAYFLIRQMKSFKRQSNASSYATNRGSYLSKANLTVSRDIYLYRTTTRQHSPQRSSSSGGGGGTSTFSGSSGASHGGGGSSF